MNRRSFIVQIGIAIVGIFFFGMYLYKPLLRQEVDVAPVANAVELVRDHSPIFGPKDAPVTIVEFFDCYKESDISVNFIISEDGSNDNSVEQIQQLQKIYPVQLISDPTRKGYSKAVIDGLKMVNTDVVSFIDSDGQCDPKDLERLLTKFNLSLNLINILQYSIVSFKINLLIIGTNLLETTFLWPLGQFFLVHKVLFHYYIEQLIY